MYYIEGGETLGCPSSEEIDHQGYNLETCGLFFFSSFFFNRSPDVGAEEE